ncbi:HAD family hydrolase [Arthrobacter sp. Hz1]
MPERSANLLPARVGATLPAPFENLAGIKVVLFDLDGTLHDDPRMTDHYAAALEKSLPNGDGESFRGEIAAVLRRTHPALAPGCFVEPTRGVVVHAPEWTATTATDWAGNPVPLPDDLHGGVSHDGPLRYLGDQWQIIGALAARRGADQRLLREAFTGARRFINAEATSLLRSEHLDDVLQRLGEGRRLLLATNTPEELAGPLVQRLDLREPFEMVRFDAHKPAGCAELITHAKDHWDTDPREVLVVGDNLWNDLLPPAERGCLTVHIDPLNIDPGARWSSARHADFSSFATALKEIPDGI